MSHTGALLGERHTHDWPSGRFYALIELPGGELCQGHAFLKSLRVGDYEEGNHVTIGGVVTGVMGISRRWVCGKGRTVWNVGASYQSPFVRN